MACFGTLSISPVCHRPVEQFGRAVGFRCFGQLEVAEHLAEKLFAAV